MISVQTNNSTLAILNAMNKNNVNMNKTMERISTGFKINSAADGPAEFAIMSKLSSQLVAMQAAKSNAEQGTAVVKMADASAGQIQDILDRLKSLATSAASAQNTTELAPLEAERVKLESQITNIATATAYNGVKLLDGTGGAMTFQVGTTNTAADQVTASFNNAYDATALGLGGAGADFTTQANAQGYIATIDAAINTTITQRADLGSTVNVMGYVQSNIETSIEQITASVSAIKDSDMAKEAADLTKYQILQQAQLATFSQANQNSQAILSLFR